MASRSIPSRIQRFRPSIIKPIITIKRPTPNPPYPPPSEFHQINNVCNVWCGGQFGSEVNEVTPLEIFKFCSLSDYIYFSLWQYHCLEINTPESDSPPILRRRDNGYQWMYYRTSISKASCQWNWNGGSIWLEYNLQRKQGLRSMISFSYI